MPLVFPHILHKCGLWTRFTNILWCENSAKNNNRQQTVQETSMHPLEAMCHLEITECHEWVKKLNSQLNTIWAHCGLHSITKPSTAQTNVNEFRRSTSYSRIEWKFHIFSRTCATFFPRRWNDKTSPPLAETLHNRKTFAAPTSSDKHLHRSTLSIEIFYLFLLKILSRKF